MAAADLQVSDAIAQANGRPGVVQTIDFVYHTQTMYNFTVAEAHTYFVGEGQSLVHNLCNFDVALGVREHLDGFAGNLSSEGNRTWIHTELDDYYRESVTEGFFDWFPHALKDADQIHFNLNGIPDWNKAFREGAHDNSHVTSQELYMVLTRKDLYEKTTFYNATGDVINIPFQGNKK